MAGCRTWNTDCRLKSSLKFTRKFGIGNFDIAIMDTLTNNILNTYNVENVEVGLGRGEGE